MVFIDWTQVGGAWALSVAQAHGGASSVFQAFGGVGRLRHNTFSVDQCYVRAWVYGWPGINCGITHASYGDLLVNSGAIAWHLLECYFWYDVGANTRWGRIFYDNVQVGVDTNFGAGAPAAGLISLYASNSPLYYDDVGLYA